MYLLIMCVYINKKYIFIHTTHTYKLIHPHFTTAREWRISGISELQKLVSVHRLESKWEGPFVQEMKTVRSMGPVFNVSRASGDYCA